MGIIKHSFWPGVRFSDIDELNDQARLWCDRLNQKVHRTTLRVPMDCWIEEQLMPLPTDFVWERFGTEQRRVSWDGFISYDGVLYGLPSQPAMAGALLLVRERKRDLRIFHQGELVVTLQKRPRSQEIVLHPEQFQQVAPVASMRQAAQPMGHQIEPPQVAIRSLTEYDQLFGLEVQA